MAINLAHAASVGAALLLFSALAQAETSVQADNAFCAEPGELPEGLEPATFALDGNLRLHMVPCWSGAYNLASLITVSGDDGGEAQQLLFADFVPELGWVGTPVLVNAAFDEETGTLTSFNKTRGAGDCGSSGIWQWHDGAFMMIEFRARACTDHPVNPEDWPLLYSADDQVRP